MDICDVNDCNEWNKEKIIHGQIQENQELWEL